MVANRLLPLLFTLCGLSSSFAAAAQATGATSSSNPAPTAAAPTPSFAPNAHAQRSRYAAAHDSRRRLVADIHTSAEGRLGVFTASRGSLGGLHWRVRG